VKNGNVIAAASVNRDPVVSQLAETITLKGFPTVDQLKAHLSSTSAPVAAPSPATAPAKTPETSSDSINNNNNNSTQEQPQSQEGWCSLS